MLHWKSLVVHLQQLFSLVLQKTQHLPLNQHRQLKLITPVLRRSYNPQEHRFGDAGDAALAETTILLPRQRRTADEGC